MFNVIMKGDTNNNILHVFAVNKNDLDKDTEFLLYDAGKWKWYPSCMFEPVIVNFDEFIKSKASLMAELTIETDKIINEKNNEEGEINA